MTPVSPRLVFVYGTLRRGDVRDINLLKPTPRFVAHASVGGTMYHLGGYPGIVLGGEGRIQGEVYEVGAELERVLDEIEEVWPQQTGEYSKCEVVVQLEPARDASNLAGGLRCFLYEIAHDRIVGKLLIASGDWMRR